jgi:hypothetical protein
MLKFRWEHRWKRFPLILSSELDWNGIVESKHLGDRKISERIELIDLKEQRIGFRIWDRLEQ